MYEIGDFGRMKNETSDNIFLVSLNITNKYMLQTNSGLANVQIYFQKKHIFQWCATKSVTAKPD